MCFNYNKCTLAKKKEEKKKVYHSSSDYDNKKHVVGIRHAYRKYKRFLRTRFLNLSAFFRYPEIKKACESLSAFKAKLSKTTECKHPVHAFPTFYSGYFTPHHLSDDFLSCFIHINNRIIIRGATVDCIKKKHCIV